ncbi:MAG: hypothetical protein HKN21_02955, partial [Candidatus Eisenbacteria bacterium]|nr:hypothetical protein [Candidatus Eisenbacteria bacterium]
SLNYLHYFLSMVPDNAGNEALDSLRKLLIAPGIAIAAILFSELPIRDGIRQRTLLYPLLGPVPRWILVVVRTVATGAILAFSAIILLLIIRFLHGEGLSQLPQEAMAIALASFAYTGLFGVVHMVTKRGLFAGLATLLIFDSPLAQLPFGIRRLSLSYHTQVLGDQLVELQLPVDLGTPENSVVLSAITLLIMAAVFIGIASFLFSKKPLGELC